MTTNIFLEHLEEITAELLERLELAWWVEVVTSHPNCLYYFGPFVCEDEAKKAQPGYIEDLEQESAQVISVNLKRYQPKELTVFEDESPAIHA